MTDSEAQATAQIIPIRPTAKAVKASEAKWGAAVIKVGFSIVPSLLLRAQQRLGLSPTHLAVLLQLCDYWWDESRKPFPSKQALSERLGISPRQVQRYVAELEAAGLVTRIERKGSHGGLLTNTYDLSGLVARLKEIEPDFREAEETARKARRDAATPMSRRKAGAKTA